MQPTPPTAPAPEKRVPAPPQQPKSEAASSSPAAAQHRPASQDGVKTPTQAAPAPPPAGASKRPAPPPSGASGRAAPSAASSAAGDSPSDSRAATSSSTRLPAGGALALARQASDVHQDIELYQAVAVELGDTPALQSLLYTHRNVIGDGPTCDEELQSVNASVTKWGDVRRKHIDAESGLACEAAKRDAAEAMAVEEQRRREVEQVLARMQEAFDSVDRLDQVRTEREHVSAERQRNEASQRRERDNANVQEYCEGLDEFERQRRIRLQQIDFADQRGKIEVNETLERGLNLSAEEKGRVALARLRADDRELARLSQQTLLLRRHIEDQHHAASMEWQTWANHLATRCGHQTQIMQLREAHRQHVAAAAEAERELMWLEETRAFEAIYLQGIELGVKSASERKKRELEQQERQQQQAAADAAAAAEAAEARVREQEEKEAAATAEKDAAALPADASAEPAGTTTADDAEKPEAGPEEGAADKAKEDDELSAPGASCAAAPDEPEPEATAASASPADSAAESSGKESAPTADGDAAASAEATADAPVADDADVSKSPAPLESPEASD